MWSGTVLRMPPPRSGFVDKKKFWNWTFGTYYVLALHQKLHIWTYKQLTFPLHLVLFLLGNGISLYPAPWTARQGTRTVHDVMYSTVDSCQRWTWFYVFKPNQTRSFYLTQPNTSSSLVNLKKNYSLISTTINHIHISCRYGTGVPFHH